MYKLRISRVLLNDCKAAVFVSFGLNLDSKVNDCTFKLWLGKISPEAAERASCVEVGRPFHSVLNLGSAKFSVGFGNRKS